MMTWIVMLIVSPITAPRLLLMMALLSARRLTGSDLYFFSISLILAAMAAFSFSERPAERWRGRRMIWTTTAKTITAMPMSWIPAWPRAQYMKTRILKK